MHPVCVASAAWVLAKASSNVPFYVAGGALVGWALVMVIAGMRRPDFPGSAVRARAIMVGSLALVAATMTAAVLTASEEAEEEPGRAAATPTSPAAGSASVLKLAADPGGKLAFDTTKATVKAGAVTISLSNQSALPHNVTIAAGSKTVASTKTIQRGTTTARAHLRPGTYVFYCSVPGHREGGMEGRLTVR
jgi:plastocyanin